MSVVMLVSCNLDFFPSDELNADVLLQDAGGAEYIMDGCYALLKDEVDYISWPSGNSFVRHYFQMSEFPSDNVCLYNKSTDPLFQACTLTMTDNLQNVSTLWMLAYKIIFMSNTVIETLDEGNSKESDQLLGEAYFMRGWMHLNLVTLYAKPYLHGRNNKGIPLHITTSNESITRASVGDVYDQIVKDLGAASQLMGASRGNKGYPCKETAFGILSRVYLYMGKWTECVNTINEMLAGANLEDKLEDSNAFANYFSNAKTSKETLFCIAHELTDNRVKSSIGSMYNGHGEGWGQVYPSNKLLYLYERYATDIRYAKFIEPQTKSNARLKAYLPIEAQEGSATSGRRNAICTPVADGENYTCTYAGDTYKVEKILVNGEYYEYHTSFMGENDVQVRICPEMEQENNMPKYYVFKYSYQDGDAMLSSPVVCRWAEVILNRAEAYAHLGQDAKALADVNVIRTRAGIPAEGMFAAGTMHGYKTVLDVVLDERRMELAFEGHRLFDCMRNNINIDRRYPGAQSWEMVKYTDDRLQYPIPEAERSVSGIDQNPGY